MSRGMCHCVEKAVPHAWRRDKAVVHSPSHGESSASRGLYRLAWDLKFLFLDEVGDPFLAVGNLCRVTSYQCRVQCRVACAIAPRRQCLAPANVQGKGCCAHPIARGVLHLTLTIAKECWRLTWPVAPG
ncbi:hypothetical protein HAX54_000821 [Datura stramonium]|uniref:Uncharacterized protein n=1 Tax=Datura stramonium TaxID=4076 RepID=A0ABS8WQB9_DATST|nr:hypothetical protein [Datura stramonium]